MMRLFLTLNLVLLSGAAAFAQEASDDKAAEVEKEPLSLTEFSTQQRALFNKADKNFDGRITRDEAQMVRFESQKESYKKRFKGLDTNYSGYLEYSEIEAWHQDYTEKQVKSLDDKRNALLNSYDLDKNGTISSYELDEVFEAKAEKERAKVQKNADRDLKNKDSDGSGAVSLDEYFESKMPKSNPLAKLNNNALVQDSNGDGIITRSENEDYISKGFDYLDMDDDGELSAKEQKNTAMGMFQSFQPHSIFLMSGDLSGTKVILENR